MPPYRLNTELFTLPGRNGSVVLYAPLSGFVGEVTPAVAALLENLETLSPDGLDESRRGAIDRLIDQGVINGPHLSPPRIPRKEHLSPSKLTLFPTDACTLRCTYCYAHANGSAVHEMPPDVAAAAIAFYVDVLKREGRSLFGLEFFGGGEPLHAWDLVTSTIFLAERRCREEGFELRVSAGTNGVLSDRKRAWISRHFSCLNISFDVLPDIQHAHRPTRSGANSFAAVDATLRHLDRLNFPYALRCTVSRLNEDRLREAVDFVLEHYRARLLYLEPVSDSGCGPSPLTRLQPDLLRFADSFADLVPFCAERGLRLETSCASLERIRPTFCSVGTDDFAVTPDGLLTNCWEVTRGDHPLADPFIFGRLLPDGDVEVDPRRLERLRALTVDRIPACAHCFAKWHCGGGCPVKLGHRDYLGPRDPVRCEATRRLLKNKILNVLEDGPATHPPHHTPDALAFRATTMEDQA